MVITVCADELVFFRFHKVVAADYSVEFSDFYAEAAVGERINLSFGDWKYPSTSDGGQCTYRVGRAWGCRVHQ